MVGRIKTRHVFGSRWSFFKEVLAVGKLSLVIILCSISSRAAADIPYIRHYPLGEPKPINRTSANEELDLYGVFDKIVAKLGMSEARWKTLNKIAQAFSPILVKNTDTVPLDINTVIARRTVRESAPILVVDTWELSGEKELTLIRQKSGDFS